MKRLRRSALLSRQMKALAERGATGAALRMFVHDILNPIATIRFTASALRMSKTLTDRELADVRRMEEAGGMVAKMIAPLAVEADLAMRGVPERQLLDLHVLCCELAEQYGPQGHAIYCRAFGDPRGTWDRAQITRVVSELLRLTLSNLGKRSSLNIIVTGLRRHVRLDLHGLGCLTEKKRRDCLEEPSRILSQSGSSIGATITATVSTTGGTILTLRLPK